MVLVQNHEIPFAMCVNKMYKYDDTYDLNIRVL